MSHTKYSTDLKGLLFETMNIACGILDFDKTVKSRKEEFISKKYAIIYFAYDSFNYFIEHNLEHYISEFFKMDRSTVYHAVDIMRFTVTKDVKLPKKRYYDTLQSSINLKDNSVMPVICIKDISNIVAGEQATIHISKINGVEKIIAMRHLLVMSFKDESVFKTYFQ